MHKFHTFEHLQGSKEKSKKIRRKRATVAPYSMLYRFLCNALQRASQKAKNTAQTRHICTIFFLRDESYRASFGGC